MKALQDSLLTTIKSCLCPPGDGVYTVNTAKERKQQLQQSIYQQTERIDLAWLKSLETLPQSNNAVMLGIASDCGGGILRGANWGPLFLRATLHEQSPELSYFDIGDVRVNPHLLHDKYLNELTISKCRDAFYQDNNAKYPVSPLSITELVADEFYATYPDKGLFGIGGDHSISYPLTKAYLKAKLQQDKRVAIIHFDAHTDLLVDRLGIDLCFGSWCTHILKYLHSPTHLIQIGIRSSGKPKAHWESKFGVTQHWAKEVQELGVEYVIGTILKQLQDEKIDELYVSFDIDAIDSSFVSATGTPEPDGLTPTEAMDILKALAEKYPITGADMMEIAPFTDTSGEGIKSSQQTLAVAAELSAFLLTKMSEN
ncbi:arginase family protein [Thalassotalea psychrophila]|uniref:Arginase family protein n=1 Tax=Thalassotalea psychrophila TaxID=3065647 RepID=A0ABY9TQA1_9GAMM|nr:arginase family protein [Colwelliaceae bacterium SQ149]